MGAFSEPAHVLSPLQQVQNESTAARSLAWQPARPCCDYCSPMSYVMYLCDNTPLTRARAGCVVVHTTGLPPLAAALLLACWPREDAAPRVCSAQEMLAGWREVTRTHNNAAPRTSTGAPPPQQANKKKRMHVAPYCYY